MSENVADTVDIRKINFFEIIDSSMFWIGVFLSVPGSVLNMAFFGATVGLIASIIGFLSYCGFVYGPTLYDVYQKNKRIEEINNRVVFNAPHEIIENFVLWKEEDKIILSEYQGEDAAQKAYYFGVLDNGLLVFGRRSKLKYCDPEDVSLAPPELFDIFEIENVSLQERVNENKFESVKEKLENSTYREMLDEARKELKDMEHLPTE